MNPFCLKIEYQSLTLFVLFFIFCFDNREISTLSDLYVSGNGHFGDIKNLDLPNIKALDLSSNHIYGTFPVDAFRGKSMALLQISRNSISGTFDFDFKFDFEGIPADHIAFRQVGNCTSGKPSYVGRQHPFRLSLHYRKGCRIPLPKPPTHSAVQGTRIEGTDQGLH